MEGIIDQHQVWRLIGDVLLILALAGLVIPALQRMRISPVLGYLLCGLVIGPNMLGLLANDYPRLTAFTITDSNIILALAEFGVVFLLFMIGLELTFTRLWELRRLVLGLGSLQILITGLVIFAIAIQFDNTLPTAILLGSCFALSSTAMVMQLMHDWHMLSRPIGRICFSVLLMQDLAVVPMLVLVGVLSGVGEGSIWIVFLEALLVALLVVVTIYAIGKLFLRPLLRLLSPAQNTEWLLAVTLFLVIGAAYLTQVSGLSAALGAFLAGLLIAETEYRHEIEVIIDPVKGLLMGVFFLSVGMVTDVGAIAEYPLWLPLSVVGIFVIKTIIFYPLARSFSIPKPQAAQASVLLAQCGEFAFIVIGLAMVGGLIPEGHAQFFLLVTAVSLLVTPFTTRLAFVLERSAWLAGDMKSDHIPASIAEGGHVIIAGFGRVGQTLASILDTQMIPYVAIDSSGVNVSHLRAEGFQVVYGNGRQIDLWRLLNVENARAAVIAIDEHAATGDILRSLRRHWPLLPVVVRVGDTRNVEAYYAHGATAVVPETLESTLQLARTLLTSSGIDGMEVQKIIEQYRQETLLGETALSQDGKA